MRSRLVLNGYTIQALNIIIILLRGLVNIMLSITYLPALWLSLMLVGIFCEACLEKYIAILLTPSAAAALVSLISGAVPETQLDVFIVTLTILLILRALLSLIHKHSEKRIEIERMSARAVRQKKDNSDKADNSEQKR